LALAAIVFSAGCLSGPPREIDVAVESGPRKIICHKVSRTPSPRIDGKLDDAAWKTVNYAGTFFAFYGRKANKQSRIKVLYDDKNFYVAFECLKPDMENAVADAMFHDGNVWKDDEVEVLIDATSDASKFYQFLVNIAARRQDIEYTPRAGTEKYQADVEWDGTWTAKTSRYEDSWTAEIAIPFRTLRTRKPENNSSWYVQFGRHDVSGTAGKEEWSAWTPFGKAFWTRTLFGEMIFMTGAGK